MGTYIAAIILVLYLVLAWSIGSFLRLQGASLWILRCGLILIGLAAAGFYFWFHRRLRQRQAGLAPPTTGMEEIGVLLKQADQKLRRSKQRSLRSFPIVFIMGESNTAKTSTVLNAGLAPDLLAGHVFRDSEVVPTAAINVWFAKDTVFIETGGKLLANQQMWMSLLRKTAPRRLSAALGRGHQAPRATLVCFSCDQLNSAHSSAQTLGSRLKEMAQSLGAAFPIYVLLTKMDLLAGFNEFVANFTGDEARQVLGATLPQARIEGVWADEQSKRLAKAFDQIIYSLAEKRLDYLGRETAAEKRPSIYEFSRELGKLRNQVIQFLVEMSHPTQLNINPFLRGFYFSGVRPVVVNEAMSVAASAPNPVPVGSGATRMFSQADKESQVQVAPLQSVKSRRIPEWTFLPHLFTDIVLRDGVAFSSSRQSRRVDTLRALLLVGVSLLFLALSGAFLISFFNNRRLENAVQQAARGLNDIPPTSGLPTLEGLQQLEQLRSTVADLGRYKDEGAPLSYSFGLYSGNSIYSDSRTLYFTQFQRMLLTSTQAKIVSRLKRLPETARESDEFDEPYKSLKAYLITTDFPAKSTQEFLSPVLFDRWLEGQSVDPERARLARLQFDFYSNELRRGIPITASSDSEAVRRARAYLTSGGFENVYRRILFAIAGNRPPINFNRMYPGSSRQVIDSYEVPAAFTREGFMAMQEVIRNPEKFFQGEDWVLGSSLAPGLSADMLRQQLPVRYTTDFLNHWRRFIKEASIVRFVSLPDASSKLQALSGNASPLLQLFTLVAQNTGVDSPIIANVLQSPQSMAGKPDQLVGGVNQPYVQALLQLQTSVANLAAAFPHGTTDPSATQPVQQTAGSAHAAVGQIAQSFRVDTEGHVDAQVHKLMEDPIVYAEALVRAIGPSALNGAGQEFCSQFQVLGRKYPLNPKASEEVSLEELKFFQPGGALWSFYDSNLKNILQRQGSQFAQNPSSPIRISPQFVGFLSRAAAISDALFPPGSSGPRLTYTLTQPVTKGIDKLSLEIDGRVLTGSGGASQQFVWPSELGQGLRLTASYSGSSPLGLRNYPGHWAIFHFLQEAEWKPKGSGYEVQLPVKVGEQQITLQDGTPLFVRYEIDANGARFFLNLQGLHCPPLGAH